MGPNEPLAIKSTAEQTHNSRFWKIILFALIAFIAVVGIYARFKELAWHFTNVDDMGVAKDLLKFPNDPFVIPKRWTYAPLQFLFTRFLISPAHGYRELLFWGRLLPCVFGILTIFSAIPFYRSYKGKTSHALVFAMTLLTSSWMLNIHSRQMHNYSMGVLLSMLLMIVFIRFINRSDFGFKAMLSCGFFMSMLCYVHYQLLFFLPAFYLTLFIYALRHKLYVGFKRLALNFSAGGITLITLFFPLWFFFLRLNALRGGHAEGEQKWGIVYWNRGPHDEFVLNFMNGQSLWEYIQYGFSFLVKNTYIVLQSNLAFIPENHILIEPISEIFFILFIAGVMSYFFSQARCQRYMGLFLGLLAGTWIALLAVQLIALSPTRHSLLLTVPMLIVVVDGLVFLLDLFFKATKRPWLKRFHQLAPGLISIPILVLFLTNFHIFLDERRDLFVESEIITLFEKYKVTHALYADYVDNLDEMNDLSKYLETAQKRYSPPTFAWISKSGPIDFIDFLSRSPCCLSKKFQLIYTHEQESNREIDYSTRAKYSMVRNRRFTYIAKMIP